MTIRTFAATAALCAVAFAQAQATDVRYETVIDDYTAPINASLTTGYVGMNRATNISGLTKLVYSQVISNPLGGAMKVTSGDGKLTTSNGDGMYSFTNLTYFSTDTVSVAGDFLSFNLSTNDPLAQFRLNGQPFEVDRTGKTVEYTLASGPVGKYNNTFAYTNSPLTTTTFSNLRAVATPEPVIFPVAMIGIGGFIARRLRRKQSA